MEMIHKDEMYEAEVIMACNKCGAYNPACVYCNRGFDKNEIIYCERDTKQNRHFCAECFNKLIIQQIKKLFIFKRDETFKILDNLKEYVQWQYSGKKVLHRGNLKTMLLWIDEIKENISSDWLGGEECPQGKQSEIQVEESQNNNRINSEVKK